MALICMSVWCVCVCECVHECVHVCVGVWVWYVCSVCMLVPCYYTAQDFILLSVCVCVCVW